MTAARAKSPAHFPHVYDGEGGMQSRVLIIEQDSILSERLADRLGRHGCACAQAFTCDDGIALAQSEAFDLIVLDSAFPGVKATDVLRVLHARGPIPILVLCGRKDASAISALLGAGAQDYVTRPVDPEEFALRCGVLLRRFGEASALHILRYRELALDPAAHAVTLCGRPLSLTKQEYRILELMLSFPPGRVFSKQDFFNYAWDDYYAGVDKTVNVHICNIRRKFRQVTSAKYIETVWSLGFRLAG